LHLTEMLLSHAMKPGYAFAKEFENQGAPMKAIIYTRYGPPDVLKLVEREHPAPTDDEVLVKVHAASVNAADWRMLIARPFLARMYNGLLRPRRQVLGADVAGTVEAVGSNVRRFKHGDAVFGDLMRHGWGGFAEYALAPEDAFASKPAGLSFVEAAALPMAGVTALQGLRDAGEVQPGEKVLIHGASGGVGTFAVQLAKHLGAEVSGVCSTGKVDLIRSLGADHVIDYTREDFTRSDERWDLILAANGDHPIRDYQRALRPGGRYVMAGGSSRQMFEALLLGRLVFMGSGQRMAALSARVNPQDLALLAELVEAGKVKPVIDRHYPLREVPDAIRYVAGGHARGKVVIDFAGP
jgi:NADPH:quinone reductase-like Zn-dependent oxidoreductase